MVESQEGPEVEAAFTVIRAQLGSIPEGRMQVLSHLTPEHVWQPRLLPKDNALHGLGEVVFAVDDPAESAARMAQFTGRTGADRPDGGTEIRLDRGRLVFLPIEAANARYDGRVATPPSVAGVGLISSDLAKTAAFLAAQNITAVSTAEGLMISPEHASGVCLTITAL